MSYKLALAGMLVTMAMYVQIPLLPVWMSGVSDCTNVHMGMVMGLPGIGVFALGCFCSYLVQRYRRNMVCVAAVLLLGMCIYAVSPVVGDALPSDLSRPGHVFPLIARSGGVLERVGHTEASVDLSRLAGLTPAAVICEIVNDDGTMARRDNLMEFSKKYNLKFITVAQLIEYRLQKEMFVKREAVANLPSDFGDFKVYGYINQLSGVDQVAIVKDDGSDKIPMVRVHSECLTGDIFHSKRCDCQNQLESALKLIESYGKGALIYIRGHEGRGIGLVNKIKAYALQENGQDTVQANISLGFKPDLRNYGIGAQILRDLGYTKIKLITNNPTKIVALKGYGLEITERVALKTPLNRYNEKYMHTKVDKMEHLIDL